MSAKGGRAFHRRDDQDLASDDQVHDDQDDDLHASGTPTLEEKAPRRPRPGHTQNADRAKTTEGDDRSR